MTSIPQRPTIWVDADACPGPIKDILFRAAQRTAVAVVLVANHPMRVPPGGHVKLIQVSSGFDVADNLIVERLRAGDLVVTSDIPLADEVLSAGGEALSPRGEVFSPDTIKARLSMRDFLETMRASGLETGGPSAMSMADRKAFAAGLDHYLQRAA